MNRKETIEMLDNIFCPAPEQIYAYWHESSENQRVEALEKFLARHAARLWVFEHEIPQLGVAYAQLDDLGIMRAHFEDIHMAVNIEELIYQRDLRVGKWKTKAEIAALLLSGKE